MSADAAKKRRESQADGDRQPYVLTHHRRVGAANVRRTEKHQAGHDDTVAGLGEALEAIVDVTYGPDGLLIVELISHFLPFSENSHKLQLITATDYLNVELIIFSSSREN
jgi:hypothetical protein